MSRNYICTRNNPDVSTEEYLQKFFDVSKAQYICGQLEKGAEGTPHIQFFVNFKNSEKIARLTKTDPRGHYEKVIINNGADNYCMKEDTRLEGPFEFGIKPVKRNSKVDWEEVKQKAKEGRLDEIPADIYVKHYGNLQKIKKDSMITTDKDHLRGVWIWGRSGIGKSRKAREDYPNHYPKLCNKWWDGYQGQKHVIMDDIGMDHKCLGQQLKIWTDRYGCILETKGGALVDEYEWFVVTS